MNKETGERLFRYRKANHYSQEDLSEKIGVSRQAISKWERGESSPDTDNLIELARLYNITIDELINGTDEPETNQQTDNDEAKRTQNDDNEKENENEPKVSFTNGIHVHDGKDKVDISFSGIHVETKNGERVHIGGSGIEVDGVDEDYIFKRKPSWMHALLPICAIIAYLILGFVFEKGWAIGWLLFLLIPIIESSIAAVKTNNPSAFAYPVLVVAIYLTVGMLMGIWHPTWIIFLTIPVYYIITDAIKQKKMDKEHKAETNDNIN